MGLNELIFTLLIFSIYPQITKKDISSLSIILHTIAMQKTIDKVWRYIVSQQINNIFDIWNRLFIVCMYHLSINLPILVY